MAETRDPRAEADPIGIVIGIRDRWVMNPADLSITPPPSPLNLCQEGLCPGISGTSCILAIVIKQRNFLKKKFNDLINTLNSVSLISWHGITVTDRGIIETTLKTSFSRSHFSLFSPIPIEQIPAFPRKEKRVRTRSRRESVTTAWPTGVTSQDHRTDDLSF